MGEENKNDSLTIGQEIAQFTAGAFERPDETPPEGADPRSQEVSTQRLRGEQSDQAPGTVSLPGLAQTPGAGKPFVHMKGERPEVLPQDLQQERQAIAQTLTSAEKALIFTRIQESQSLAQSKADAQYILAEDANELRRLNEENFSRWEVENAQFRKDIDDARALKINPNNYMQSVGRSGRVASTLAVAISQMAAGAGNPNSAWLRLQASLKQDIAAQKANIELKFKGIEAGRQQQVHEQSTLAEYYVFEDKARAVALTAIAAQMGVAKQKATSEGLYNAYQTVELRARAASLDAFAIAASKNTSIYFDGPIKSRADFLRKKRLADDITAAMRAQTPEVSGLAQPVDGTIETLTGAQFGEQPAVEAPVEEAAPAPTSAAADVARDRRRPSAPVSAPPAEAPTPAVTQEAPAASPEEAGLLPGQADMERRLEATTPTIGAPEGIAKAPVSKEEKAAKKAQEEFEAEKAYRENFAKDFHEVVGQNYTRKQLQDGGFAYSQWKAEGRVPQGIPTFTTAAKRLADPNDPTIALFPSYEDARVGLQLDQRGDSSRKKYEQAHPELYEWETNIKHPGTATNPEYIESNTLDTAWGRIKLKRGSLLRDDEKQRAELTKQINVDYGRVKAMFQQAQRTSEGGLASFFGIVNFSKSGGIDFTPFNPESTTNFATNISGAIQLGVEAMKLLDPSGRLTDQDIMIGQKIMTTIGQSGTAKVADLLESTWKFVTGGKYEENAARQSMQRFMVALAAKMQTQLATQQYHDIVLDYDQANDFRTERAEVSNWLNSSAPIPAEGMTVNGKPYKASK